MSEKKGNDSELQVHIRELLSELSDVTHDRDKHLQKLLQEIITVLRMNGFRFVYIGGEATGVSNRSIDIDHSAAITQLTSLGIMRASAIETINKIKEHTFDLNTVMPSEHRQKLANIIWEVN